MISDGSAAGCKVAQPKDIQRAFELLNSNLSVLDKAISELVDRITSIRSPGAQSLDPETKSPAFAAPMANVVAALTIRVLKMIAFVQHTNNQIEL